MPQPPTDAPMSLGRHLDELRRRIIWPLVTLGVVMVVAFAFSADLMLIMVHPLRQAVNLVPVQAQELGLPLDSDRLLTVLNLSEAAMGAAWVSMCVGIAAAVPVFLWHAWQFVAVGLKPNEKRLVFLFVPAGVICFYCGCVVGYFFGLPYFYAMLITYTAQNPVIHINGFRLSEYIDDFILWTVILGVVLSIPWAIVCVVRTGLIRPATIAKARRYVIFANVVIAAFIVPDAVSMCVLAVVMQLLFEVGLLVGRLVAPKPASLTDAT